MTLMLAVPRMTGPIAELLAGVFGLVLLLVTLIVVLVGGWAWETEQRWFTKRVAQWWRYVLVPVLVLASAATTVIRLFALS